MGGQHEESPKKNLFGNIENSITVGNLFIDWDNEPLRKELIKVIFFPLIGNFRLADLGSEGLA